MIEEERIFIDKDLTSKLIFATVAAAFGSGFQHGYNTGVVNAPQSDNIYSKRSASEPYLKDTIQQTQSSQLWKIRHNLNLENNAKFGDEAQQIQNFINETYSEKYNKIPTASIVTIIFSLKVSVYCLGGMIGSLGTAYLAARFGPKGGLLLNNFLSS
ncbi:glucose transporter type 1 [Caerostris extrusa]|uniref:Glucose transporter type 1 n=1 Tax=Caerostris extrusa TaxID=172846 RepID=A0AAV4MR35_CAEEX|nr:glucose transporter type 1 [Caerostris extrusa]